MVKLTEARDQRREERDTRDASAATAQQAGAWLDWTPRLRCAPPPPGICSQQHKQHGRDAEHSDTRSDPNPPNQCTHRPKTALELTACDGITMPGCSILYFYAVCSPHSGKGFLIT